MEPRALHPPLIPFTILDVHSEKNGVFWGTRQTWPNMSQSRGAQSPREATRVAGRINMVSF